MSTVVVKRVQVTQCIARLLPMSARRMSTSMRLLSIILVLRSQRRKLSKASRRLANLLVVCVHGTDDINTVSMRQSRLIVYTLQRFPNSNSPARKRLCDTGDIDVSITGVEFAIEDQPPVHHNIWLHIGVFNLAPKELEANCFQALSALALDECRDEVLLQSEWQFRDSWRLCNDIDKQCEWYIRFYTSSQLPRPLGTIKKPRMLL